MRNMKSQLTFKCYVKVFFWADKQTGQKQYAPNLSMRGYKNKSHNIEDITLCLFWKILGQIGGITELSILYKIKLGICQNPKHL